MATQKIRLWDNNAINDGTNYRAWFPKNNGGLDLLGLPNVNAQMVERTGYWPVLGSVRYPSRRVVINVSIEGADKETLRAQLLKWFRPIPPLSNFTGAAIKRLVIENRDGTNDRFIEAVCIACTPSPDDTDIVYTMTLEVHKDPAWRKITSTNLTVWNPTSGTDGEIVAIAGEDIAYPVFTFTPQAALTGSYAHRCFIPLRWNETLYGGNLYPIDICNDAFNTSTLVSGGKMQADGDDLRVFVNGIERDRWLSGINTTTTKVWVNFDYLPDVPMTLAASIASSGAVDTITVNGNISGLHGPGLVQIDNEIFYFTDKIIDSAISILTGVTRAAHGSSMAAHTAGANVLWLQNEVYIAYGNSSAAAPVTDDNYKPMFDLDASTNTSWVYTDFGQTQSSGLRSASWTKGAAAGTTVFYTANRATNANPWSEMGAQVTNQGGMAQTALWQLYNPCGITNANFTNGEQYVAGDLGTDHARAQIVSLQPGLGWETEYIIPPPSTLNTWEAWSRNEALTTTIAVGLMLSIFRLTPLDQRSLEVADVTLTLDSTKTPTTSIGAEQGGYLLDVLITNINFQVAASEFSTNPGIRVKFLMEIGQSLVVDTYNKTVVYEKDFSSQAQAVTLYPSPRRDWFPLEGGTNNTLAFVGAGTTDLDIAISYVERYLT